MDYVIFSLQHLISWYHAELFRVNGIRAASPSVLHFRLRGSGVQALGMPAPSGVDIPEHLPFS